MPQPDDIDLNQALRELRRQVIRYRGPVIAGAIVLALVIGFFTCYYTVKTNGQAVVTRFGQVVSVTDPGLHFKLPFGIDHAQFVPTQRVMKEEFGFRTTESAEHTQYQKSASDREESLMLTGDLNVIDVEWVVQYRIFDQDSDPAKPADAAAAKWLFSVNKPRQTVRDISEAVMRRVIGNHLGVEALTTGRAEISTEVLEEMRRILAHYDMGVHIRTVEMQRVTPPNRAVTQAYNEVNEAQQQKEQTVNEAKAYRNGVLPQARGQAAQLKAQAKGYQAQRVNAAKGEASRFTAILKEYRKAEDITRQRMYLEMIDNVMPGLGKLYVIDPEQTGPVPLLNLGGKGPAP